MVKLRRGAVRRPNHGLRRLRRGALSYGQVGRGRVCRVMAVAIRLDEARRVVLWRGGCVKMCCCKVGSA